MEEPYKDFAEHATIAWNSGARAITHFVRMLLLGFASICYALAKGTQSLDNQLFNRDVTTKGQTDGQETSSDTESSDPGQRRDDLACTAGYD